ncbi:MAG: methyltransferase domain-containing protein [Bryobacterales bacterium]|nr:methyltransferase domain-containing protein [Bryobacterales bacterium]
MTFPRRNPTLLFCPGEEGYLAYDPAADRIHRLNPVASLIAELCDGRRSVDQIEMLVERALPTTRGSEVPRCIREGSAAGLFVSWRGGARADDPAGLSQKLREEGKIEAAYICRYAAAETDPENVDHWSALGELAHILGRREQARQAYERVLELTPSDAETRHILTALRGEAPPPRASNAVIEQLYERFSTFYESNVLDELDFQGPKRLAALAEQALPGREGLAALDLGCGSGLAGAEIKARCRRLVGVDLSQPMVRVAQERGVYDLLEVAEITDWLAACSEQFDLVVACDSLIYFGDLRETVQRVATLLTPGGAMVLSLEKGEVDPFALSDSGRYTHHPGHVRAAAAAAGLNVQQLEEGFLRMEYGEEVTGLFAALHKP